MITALLAQTPGTPTGPEFGKASPLGLVIVLVLLAGTVLLIWSMNKHIKNLPATFSPEHPEPDQAADEGTDPGAVRAEAEPVEQGRKNESSGAS
ncbi:hypothetical protein IU501_01445 [Nocardia otitidiscaviarum]|uniref:Uncharacterized protein n=1 Tax=Nocardia otitidiscaviarum TaxID=1823 RepID=A0A516NFS7_9NOCA|nr:hypothetical protein [Nocardia otitidiscaviarum]MBF6131669.1 hypothetical protein [Nocardia otitidiscaviarum]MBF6178270.1 hypothetical protein [Nocardia otitidiscaviarum]MBF6482801.1 hypothetical protein [Nocardia otitidiscaviarum]MCP9623096.1 hypothetical protein [Nocardia otitidiscaviarum]QDP77760.1 hypothetical protein FOH10_02350 [Nocardia otitidiscaviarum]